MINACFLGFISVYLLLYFKILFVLCINFLVWDLWGQGTYDPAHALLGPGAMPRRVFAEAEWGKAEVSSGTAEDDPVLGTPRLQGEEQCLDDGCPQKAP